MSKNTIECEIRGCITPSDFHDIRSLIERDWGKLDESPELIVFFKDVYDLRLRINKYGIALVTKKTLNRKSGIRRETEVSFSLDQISNAIDFLHESGHSKGLFSYCYRYDATKNGKNFSVRFDTKIGDLFEIDEPVKNRNGIPQVKRDLMTIAAKYGLKTWSQATYSKILRESWKNVDQEPLVKNGATHPLIRKVLKEIEGSANVGSGNTSIASLLRSHSNDFSVLEKKFKEKTGEDLLSKKVGKIENYNEKVSIIIPTFNSKHVLKLTLQSIVCQKLDPVQKSLIEVIVVDDGSTDGTESMFVKNQFALNLRYIKQNNLGRVYARNLGASIAKGRILFFIDSDIILEEHFLNEHIKRQHYLDNIALLGFKENIRGTKKVFGRIFNRKRKLVPNISKDFRFEKTVKKSWLRMHRHVRNVQIRNVKILKETNNLKRFGNDRVLGVWDLPSMVVTCAVSLKHEYFKKIGGFNLQFRGWGMEDTFLGASLIASDNYIVPCFATGVFHINHPSRSGSEKEKLNEFNRNVLLYLDLVNKNTAEVFR